MRKGLKIAAIVLLSGLLIGNAALCAYAQRLGFETMWADFTEARSKKAEVTENYDALQMKTSNQAEVDGTLAAFGAEPSTDDATTLTAKIYDGCRNLVGPEENLEKDTQYTISVDAPESLFDGGTVNITMRYPKKLTMLDERQIEIWLEDEDDGKTYCATLTVRSSERWMYLIHGSDIPEVMYGGYFSSTRQNGTLEFDLYTGATEEHISTHLKQTSVTGVEGTYNLSYERQS